MRQQRGKQDVACQAGNAAGFPVYWQGTLALYLHAALSKQAGSCSAIAVFKHRQHAKLNTVSVTNNHILQRNDTQSKAEL